MNPVNFASMNQPAENSERRPMQFSLQWLLVVVVAACVLLAVAVQIGIAAAAMCLSLLIGVWHWRAESQQNAPRSQQESARVYVGRAILICMIATMHECVTLVLTWRAYWMETIVWSAWLFLVAVVFSLIAMKLVLACVTIESPAIHEATNDADSPPRQSEILGLSLWALPYISIASVISWLIYRSELLGVRASEWTAGIIAYALGGWIVGMIIQRRRKLNIQQANQ